MEQAKVFAMSVAKVYPLLVAKAERKGRTRAEVDELAKGKAMEKILRKEAAPKAASKTASKAN